MSEQIDEVLELLEHGDLQSALKKCQNVVKSNPTDANSQHLLGLIFAKLGDLSSAIAHFKLAINLDPRQAIFHNNISNAYKLLGDQELAARHLNEALQMAPNNAESFNNLGSLYYTRGDIKQAIQQFEKAIRLNPGSWEAHYNLANCYVKQDMILQAISHYQTTINLNPQHNNAQLNLAMCYVMQNDFGSALPLLILAAENNPQHAELQGHLAEAYLNLGQTENATQQYAKAIALDAKRPAWQHNLAVLYLRAGNKDLAKEHFQQALALQPDNSIAQHMLAALNSKNGEQARAEYVKLLFDQYAGYYNQHVMQTLQYNVPKLLREAMNQYINHFTAQQNILDLGCGTGLCGVLFRDLAHFSVGVDLSPAMLLEASNLGAYDALCCCNILETIPGLNQNYFDLVLAADVFVYIGDLNQLFAMIRSALTSGGKLVFTVEDQEQNSSYLLQTSGRYAHAAQYIQDLAHKHGFKIETNNPITPRIQENAAIRGRLYILSVQSHS